MHKSGFGKVLLLLNYAVKLYQTQGGLKIAQGHSENQYLRLSEVYKHVSSDFHHLAIGQHSLFLATIDLRPSTLRIQLAFC